MKEQGSRKTYFIKKEKFGARGIGLILKKVYFCRPILTTKNYTDIMKKDIHPKEYRTVVFKDMSNDYAFLTKSTVNTKDTIVWEDGNEYPLVKLEISSTSHPFFTGKMKLVDTAGRVDKFRNKYARHFEAGKTK